MGLEPLLISLCSPQCFRETFQGEKLSWSLQCDKHQLVTWVIFYITLEQRPWLWLAMCSGKPFQKLFSLPHITREPVQGLKNHTLAYTTCPQGLRCPGIQVMSPERLETLDESSSSKTPLKYSQCHWHVLANESRSWSLVFYLPPCFPFQIHFNRHELLKHWMPLSAFLKGNRCIKYIRLQVFKIKCYKYRLNYITFIP